MRIQVPALTKTRRPSLGARVVGAGAPWFRQAAFVLPLDCSARNYAVSSTQPTVNGTVSFTGQRAYVTGGGNNIAIPWSVGAGEDFTVEGEIQLTNAADIYHDFFVAYPYGIRFGNAGFGYKMQFSLDLNSVSVIYSCALTQQTLLNKKVRFAWVRRAGNLALFVEGKQQSLGTGANPSSYPYRWVSDTRSFSGTFLIGGNNFTGYAANYIVTNRVCKYDSDYTPSTAFGLHGSTTSLNALVELSNTFKGYSLFRKQTAAVYGERASRSQVALDLPFKTNFVDYSSAQRVLSVYGETHIANEGAYFDGSGNDYITISDSADWDFGTGDFSIVCDFRIDAGTGTNLYGTVYSYRYGGASFGWVLFYNQSSKDLVFTYGTNASARIDKGLCKFEFGQRYRLEVRRRNGTFYAQLDGRCVATWTDTNPLLSDATYVSLGRSLSYGDSYLKGRIYGLKVVKGTTADFYPAQPTKIYAQPQIEIPTRFSLVEEDLGQAARYPRIVRREFPQQDDLFRDVVLQLPLTQDLVDQSLEKVTGTLTGTLTYKRQAELIAADFVAPNNWIDYSTTLLSPYTTELCIECLCYPNGQPTVYPTAAGLSSRRWDLFGQGGSAGSTDQFLAYLYGGGFQFYRGAGLTAPFVLGSLATYSPNKWYRVTLDYFSGAWHMWINGAYQGAATAATPWINTGFAFTLGKQLVQGYPTWSSFWNGGIAYFRVTKRSRYRNGFRGF